MLHLVLAFAMQQTPTPTPAPPPPPPTMHVVVSPANPAVVAGDSLRLTAAVYDSAGKPVPNARVRWAGGSFEGRVDSTGVLRGGSRATFVVYAIPSVEGFAPGKPTRINVKVLARPAAQVAITPKPARLVAGQQVALTAEVRAANGDPREGDDVTWSSSAPNVARVSADGVVDALAAGNARITARAGAASSAVDVTVVRAKVGRVDVSADQRNARTGDVVHLK